jgi:hypothetical protein
MSNRFWLCLLLSISLSIFLSGRAAAQTKQSHRELPDGTDMKDVREMMAERLHELRELHHLQDLLKHRDFANEFKKQFTEEEWQKFRENLLRGDGPDGDSRWSELVRQMASENKLDDQTLRRLAESFGARKMPPLNDRVASIRPPISSGPAHSPSRAPLLSGLPPEQSPWRKMRDQSEKWLSQHLEGMTGDMAQVLSESRPAAEDAPVAEFLRFLEQTDLSLSESAMELHDNLPSMKDILAEPRGVWGEMHSLFRDVPLPSLSGLNSGPLAPSMSSAAPENGPWGTATITLLTLSVFLLLAWKMSGWSMARKEPSEIGLGAWPVAPAAVATRQDLVRAFEHLALLCLGARAIPFHHHELAGRLAEQDPDNPARRQAVELLAWLYEQARYAPAEEVLSQEELSDARHALCYLAGVTTV